MRKLLLLFALAGAASAQPWLGGTSWFFGDGFESGGPCGYGKVAGSIYNLGLYDQTGCDVIWGKKLLNSGTITVGASTGSKQYPIGAHSLLVNTDSGAGNVTWAQSAGFHPLVGSGTTFDIYMHLRVATLTLPVSTASTIWAIDQGGNNSSPIAGLNFFPATAGNDARVVCTGTTGGVGSTLTKNTDYFLKFHIVVGGAANTSTCYQASGTQWLGMDPRRITYTSMTTFRAGSQNWTYTTIGTLGNATGYAASYSIGYFFADVPGVNGPGHGSSAIFTPSFYGSAVDNIADSVPFTGGVIGGNGAWTGTPDPTNGTSVTSVACGTGSKSFTTQAGLNWVATDPIHVFNASCSMFGTVTSYSGTALVVNVASITGAGTLSSWSLIAHAMSYTAAAHIALTTPITVYGRVLPISESTPLGVTYDNRLSLASGSGRVYTPATHSPVLHVGYWLQTNLGSADTATNNSWGFTGVSAVNVVSTNILANTTSPAVTEKICLEVTSGGGSTCLTGPDWGSIISYTPVDLYFIQYTLPYYKACVAGMECLALGTPSGTLQAGETITASGGDASGAVATVVGVPTGTAPTRSLYLSLVSGTPSAADVWVGGTSGASYTTTSVPQNFVTLSVYDRSCALVGTMKTRNPSAALTQPLAWVFKIGRSGDAGSPDKYVRTDYYQVEYARDKVIPCR